MKRIIYVLLSTMLVMSLIGCGKTAENEDVKESETVVTTEKPAEKKEETEPTETVPEPTEEVVAEPTETEEPTETVEPEPEFTFTDLSQTMYAKSSVNVRDLPSTDGNRLGGLSKAQEVTVTGQCNETGWYKIQFNGAEGYVSNSYLVTEKPQVSQPVAEQPVEQPNTPPEEASNELPSCPYQLYTLIDNGDYIIFYYDYASSNAENQTLKSSLADEAFQIMMGRYKDGQNATGNELAFVGDYKEGQVYSIKTYNYIYSE